MTPQEALKLLESVTGAISLTRDQHKQILLAIDILSKLVK